MNRPTDKQIEEVLAGIATPEDAKFVAEWFATEEGNTYLDAVMTREAECLNAETAEIYVDHTIPSEKMYHQIQRTYHANRSTYLLPCGCNLNSCYFPDRSLYTDQFPGGFIRHYGV